MPKFIQVNGQWINVEAIDSVQFQSSTQATVRLGGNPISVTDPGEVKALHQLIDDNRLKPSP